MALKWQLHSISFISNEHPSEPPLQYVPVSHKERTKPTDYNRNHWEFEAGTLFQRSKEQIITEVDETLKLLGWTRLALAKQMHIQPSAVTQSLAVDKGLQLTTLIRMADAMNCDVEVNFIRRPPFTLAIPAEV